MTTKQPHNFRAFFTLVKNPSNSTNALAVCNWCVTKHGGLSAAQVKPECCTSNRARLCRSHLAKCPNFHEYNTEEEIQRILALSVPEDNKKKRKEQSIESDDDEIEETSGFKRRKLSTSSHVSSHSNQSTITNFFCRPMSPNDQLHFEQLLLRLIVSNGLPFTFVENEETIAIFQFIAPGIKLPKRKAIAEKVLKKSSEMLQENIIKIAKNDPDGVTATFDGWTNVKQEHLWGIVLITTSGKPLVWGAYDISAERSKTEDVIRHIEKLMSDANEKNINIKAFISDSAGEYAAARRQLRRKYPSKIFLPCMAHQMNLIFGEIFKESILYQRTSKEAIRIVSFFHSSTFFTGNLRDEQMRIYQKTITLITPGDTRWNSYYFCFHSILKSKSALKFLSAKFNDDRTNVTRNNGVPNIPANKKTTNQNGGRKLPDDIADIINDSEFWTTLFELQNLLYPLCGFLNKLQKDTARLHEVLHCFAYTTKIFGYHNDPEFSSKMVERMESRWKVWEQPLLILSFVLHPYYKLQKFRSSTSNLTWTHIGQWLKFYFESWFNSKPKSILAELIKYKREEDPYDMDSFNQFKGNLVDFWESTSGIGPELARVAVRIHGICVNSASVERLWSSMGYLHTNRRNRLQHKKVLAMSQIRSDILYTRKIKEARECEREVQRLHIAAPICPDDEIENHEPTTQEIDIQVSDDEDEFNNDDNNSEDELTTEEEQRWSHIIKEWIELGNRENQFEDKNDDNFLSSEWDSDFNFAGRELHPADDESAKWMLSTLFEISLESPAFLGSDEIFTNAH